MSMTRVILHGLVLTGADIASIIFAYGIYYLARPVNQIAVQAPIAAALTIAAFILWAWILNRSPLRAFWLTGRAELTGAFVTALACTPALFIPLHYFTQGYLTSPGNILAIWAFQVPVNLVAIAAAAQLVRAALHRKPRA